MQNGYKHPTAFYCLSDASKYGIIWTENNNMIDSFISEIIKVRIVRHSVLDWKNLACTIHTVNEDILLYILYITYRGLVGSWRGWEVMGCSFFFS